jgi:hypothetical protein
MSSSLYKLISSQVAAAGRGSMTVDELHEFLAPIVWEIDTLADNDAKNLLYAVELALSEFSIGHLSVKELRDELRGLSAYADVLTSASNTVTRSRVWVFGGNGRETAIA